MQVEFGRITDRATAAPGNDLDDLVYSADSE